MNMKTQMWMVLALMGGCAADVDSAPAEEDRVTPPEGRDEPVKPRQCTRVLADPPDFADMRGFKATQEFDKTSTEDAARFFSVHPELHDLWIPDYVVRGERLGANTLELRLEYRREHGTHPPDQSPRIDNWSEYIPAAFRPQHLRSAEERRLVMDVGRQISRNQYTFAQREEMLIRFLELVERVRRRDRLERDAYTRFTVGVLQWFPISDSRDRRLERIEEVVAPLASLINEAKAHCVDHLLAGVYLFEPNNRHMSNHLWIARAVARRLNQRTGGWLHRHGGLLMSGGGHGADFAGLRRVDADAFFQDIQRNTGAFAFAYKLMQFKTVGFLDGHMWAQVCEARGYDRQGQRCDADQTRWRNLRNNPFVQRVVADEDEWTFYLDELLGFGELREMIHGGGSDGSLNYRQYPNHAQVVFMGDNSDALSTSYDRSQPQSETLILEASVLALARLFRGAEAERPGANWSGRNLFHLYQTSEERLRAWSIHDVRQYRDRRPDVSLNQDVLDIWRRWPNL